MRRPFQLAVMIGVASAVPASPLLLAQAQKAEAPAQGTIKSVVIEKKVADLKDAPKAAVKVEVKRAAVKEVIIHQAAGGVANEGQVRQFTQQFRPAMRAEYYFIRNVCAPTAEQRKAVAREGEKALHEASKAYAEVQMRPVQVRNGRAVYPDPRKLLEETMARAVAPQLTPEQAARYKAESEKRAADRRQAVVRNVVAKIDSELILSPDQREKIAAAAAAAWDETWCQSLETLTYGDQFYPRLPDNLVLPHLDARQKAVWNGSRQNQNFFFGFVGNMLPDEDPQEDKELIAARVEAEKEQPPQANAIKMNRVIALPAGIAPAAPAVKAPAAKK